MAMLVDKQDLPDVNDIVTKVETHNNLSEIYFKTGKRIICHVSERQPPPYTKTFDNLKKANDIVEESKSRKDNKVSNYDLLKIAVQDLLCELRIDPISLNIMAKGYSPDYSGAINQEGKKDWNNSYCKIQISKIVAEKLIEAVIV